MAYIRRLCSPQLTYAPQGMKATAIPAGTSPQVITSPPAGDCEGAEPTLFPALLPSPASSPAPSVAGHPRRRYAIHHPLNNKKAAWQLPNREKPLASCNRIS